MRVQISGKHMDTGEALKQYVETTLIPSVGKYFENAINADVTFSKRDHFYDCHIHINEGVKDGIAVDGNGDSTDVHSSFDAALDKTLKQLRRYKRKLKDRSKKVSLSELSLQVANG